MILMPLCLLLDQYIAETNTFATFTKLCSESFYVSL